MDYVFCLPRALLQRTVRVKLQLGCTCPVLAALPSALFRQHRPEALSDRLSVPHRTVGRELQPWVPSDTDPAEAPESLLAASSHAGRGSRGSSSSWNQFQVNQDKFGVTTSFDESIYTSKLDHSRSKYSAAEADRLAAEIEGHVSGNAHLAEERGMELDAEVRP